MQNINTFITLRPRQNVRHFPDDVFKCIFLNENVWNSIKISLELIPEGPINSMPALVQIMAWPRTGDKPLSEPMMVSLPTHICVTQPQWVKQSTRDYRKHIFDYLHIKSLCSNSYGPSCINRNRWLMCTSLDVIKMNTDKTSLFWAQMMFLAPNECTISTQYTVQCPFNAVNFLKNPRNWRPSHSFPWGWDMGYLLWVQILN